QTGHSGFSGTISCRSRGKSPILARTARAGRAARSLNRRPGHQGCRRNCPVPDPPPRHAGACQAGVVQVRERLQTVVGTDRPVTGGQGTRRADQTITSPRSRPAAAGRPSCRSDQLQLEGLQHRAGAVAHAELGQGERAAPTRHRLVLPATARRAAAGRPSCRQTNCSSKAFSTARVRSRTPSLLRMLDTWFLIVPSATPSELAISLLEKPPAIN